MKKALTVFLATVFLFVPALCFSAYVIHLKDGREFTTDRYWEEGDLIKFKRYGGSIGIEKDRILKIEEIESESSAEFPEKTEMGKQLKHPDDAGVNKAEKREERASGDDSEGGKEQRQNDIKKQENPESKPPKEDVNAREKQQNESKEIDIEKHKKEKRDLLDKRRAALEDYRRARDFGNEAVKAEAKRAYKEINKQLSELAKALRKANGGILPRWWSNIR